MVGRNGVGDVLEENSLACLGRRYNESSLPLAYGSHKVQEPARRVPPGRLQFEPLVGEYGREPLEVRPVTSSLRVFAVYGLDAQETVVPLGIVGRTHLPRYQIAGPQVELADLGRRDVDVVLAWEIERRPEEAVTFVQYLKQPFGEYESACLGAGLEDLEDQFLLAESGIPGNAQLTGHSLEIYQRHVGKLLHGWACVGPGPLRLLRTHVYHIDGRLLLPRGLAIISVLYLSCLRADPRIRSFRRPEPRRVRPNSLKLLPLIVGLFVGSVLRAVRLAVLPVKRPSVRSAWGRS